MEDFFSAQKSGKAADLEALVDVTFLEYLRQLIDAGALVSVGTTRDGGAVSVTVTYDGSWRREYFHDQEECHLYMKSAAMAVEARGGRPPAPTAQRSPSRRR